MTRKMKNGENIPVSFDHKIYIDTLCVRCRLRIPIVASYNNDFYIDTDHECIPRLRFEGFSGLSFLNESIQEAYDLVIRTNGSDDKGKDIYVENEAGRIARQREEYNGEWCREYVVYGFHTWKCNSVNKCKKYFSEFEKGERYAEWVERVETQRMKTYVVTLKKYQKGHDPKNKITSKCFLAETCTDSTGHHHSLVIYAMNISDVEQVIIDNFGEGMHITRIEEMYQTIKNS